MTCTRIASSSSPLRTGLGLGLLLALASAAPSTPASTLDSTTTSNPASTAEVFSTSSSDDVFSTPSSDDPFSSPPSDDPLSTLPSDDPSSTLPSDDPSSTPSSDDRSPAQSSDDPSASQSSDDPSPVTISDDASTTLSSASSPFPSSAPSSTTGSASSASSYPSTSVPSSTASSAPSTSTGTALTPPRPDVASSPTNATRKKPQLPRSVKVCSAKDPELDICFRESANKMLKYILPGKRRLGLVRLEPLLVPSVQLQRGNAFMPALALNLSDSRQLGWARASLLDARVNLENFTILADLFFPLFRMSGHYEVDGELLGFIPLKGNGLYNVQAENCRFGVTFQGHPEHRKTGRHLKLDNLSFESKFGRIHFDLKNLFGNEKLSNLTNALMNQHSKVLGEQAGPAVDLVFSELYQGLLQRFFDVMDLDDLFPDLPSTPQNTP